MQASLELHQLRQCSKVLSLTIDAPDYVGDAEIFGRGYARARMWEHRAENHHGVCLMLRRSEFEAKRLGQLVKRSPDSWALEVSYKDRGILENPAAMMFQPSGHSAPDLRQDHVRKHLQSLFFTKVTDWPERA